MNVLVAMNVFCADGDRRLVTIARRALTALALIGMAVVAGCSRQAALQSGDATKPDHLWPSFVARGAASACPMHCKATAIYFGRAELGLDPTEKADANIEPDVLLAALRQQNRGAEAEIEVVPISDCLKDLKVGPAAAATILVHDNGHLYLLLGTIDLDGRLMCQILHGESPVSLVSKSQLESAGFREAWRFREMAETFPVHVGSGEVRIDRVSHNFGEVKPVETLECVFSLKNVGSTRLVLGKPRTSCSCMTTGALENAELAPAEMKDVGVVVRSTNSASLKQSLVLTFFEKGTGVSRRAELFLFGSQRKSMEVTPTSLDFGVIVPGRAYSRTVCLNEVPTDRFVLKNIDPGELPIVHEIEESEDKDGFAVFRIRLKLEAVNGSSGKQSGKLVFTTDSHVRPKITMPVTFEIAPPVRAVPSVVSFGAIPVGEPREECVEFVSRDGEPFDVKLESRPDDCTVVLDRNKQSPQMIVTARLKKPGIWKRLIKVKSSLGEQVIEIRCVGYGQSREE